MHIAICDSEGRILNYFVVDHAKMSYPDFADGVWHALNSRHVKGKLRYFAAGPHEYFLPEAWRELEWGPALNVYRQVQEHIVDQIAEKLVKIYSGPSRHEIERPKAKWWRLH